MDNKTFWKLIDSSRKEAEGDPEEQMGILAEKLEELSEAEIVDFDRIFTEHWVRAYHWPLWGAAYVIGQGCSDDGFADFRGWLISRGEKVYEEALADPESLARVMKDHDDNGQIEGFQYLATQAWEAKTGRDGSEFPDSGVQHPEKPTGKEWKEDEVDRLFPKLAKKFG